MNLTTNQQEYVETLRNIGIKTAAVKRSDLLRAAILLGQSNPPSWVIEKNRKISHGVYNVPEIMYNAESQTEMNTTMTNTTTNAPTMNLAATVLGMTQGDRTSLIPDINPEYVAWGHYDDIHRLINSKDFFTIYVTGMSGNGKTTMIEQICAKLGRECFRVNILGTTDEDDLIGGMRLTNGSTTWQDGPVVDAMKRGAVLLLDEVDLGSEKLMCLQSVLEGKGVYIKKQNMWVTPAKGFCIVATANTKGKGSDDGRFIGTQIMNEAFLDRFDYTYEQSYAPKVTEKKIIAKVMKKYGISDENFADNLVTWAEMTRTSFSKGAVDEIISTRRLLNIVKAYSVFGDKNKSVKMSLARFDRDTQDGFFSLYSKIDGGNVQDVPAKEEKIDNMEPPF